jgi:hypothetical protein
MPCSIHASVKYVTSLAATQTVSTAHKMCVRKQHRYQSKTSLPLNFGLSATRFLLPDGLPEYIGKRFLTVSIKGIDSTAQFIECLWSFSWHKVQQLLPTITRQLFTFYQLLLITLYAVFIHHMVEKEVEENIISICRIEDFFTVFQHYYVPNIIH